MTSEQGHRTILRWSMVNGVALLFFSTFFTWTIPVLAAIITAFISGEYSIAGVGLDGAVSWLSLLLTILTVINATARPSEDFKNSTKYASLFWTFQTLLDLSIDEIDSAKIDDEERHKLKSALLKDKISELETLVAAYNAGFLPAYSSSDSRTDAHSSLTRAAPAVAAIGEVSGGVLQRQSIDAATEQGARSA